MIQELTNAVMGYFEVKRKPKPVLRNLRKPYELLLAELISSDEPVPVPVDYATEHIFDEISIEEFCETFHLICEIVTYNFHGVKIDRAFYEFKFKSE